MLAEYVRLKSPKSSASLWVYLSCRVLAPPWCTASLPWPNLGRPCSSEQKGNIPSARSKAALCHTSMFILCERSQDTKIHLLQATRQSLKANNFQASAIWAKFELATLSPFEARQDPSRFWFCPASQRMPHAVLMGQALQDGAVWHEVNAMAVGNYMSSKPSWKHGNSLWLRGR